MHYSREIPRLDVTAIRLGETDDMVDCELATRVHSRVDEEDSEAGQGLAAIAIIRDLRGLRAEFEKLCKARF